MPSYTLAIIIVLILIVTWIIFQRHEALSSPADLDYYDFVGPNPGPFICFVAGTHGNEPGGARGVKDIIAALQSGGIKLIQGRVRIIPRVNEWGLANNSRYTGPLGIISPTGDVNRNYSASGGTDPISQRVIQLTTGADIVIDFHEGWGFHPCQSDSVGSTLMPTDYGDAVNLANECVADLNKSFGLQGCKLFTVVNRESCTITTTLACYMETQKRPYILVEITGQNDVQPMWLRRAQVGLICAVAIGKYLM